MSRPMRLMNMETRTANRRGEPEHAVMKALRIENESLYRKQATLTGDNEYLRGRIERLESQLTTLGTARYAHVFEQIEAERRRAAPTPPPKLVEIQRPMAWNGWTWVISIVDTGQAFMGETLATAVWAMRKWRELRA